MRRIADGVIDAAAIASFTAMFACVFGQVIFRYALNDPLAWSDELARYLFIWASFLGWIIAARRRSHLSVDMMVVKLPPRAAAVWPAASSYSPRSPAKIGHRRPRLPGPGNGPPSAVSP